MIELKQVTKIYNKGQENEVTALNGIDVKIAEGEFLVLVGANGSGKSTLLNTIAGSVLPISGDLIFSGSNVTKLKDFERGKWIARVFQNPLSGTAPGLSIIDNFRLAALRTQSKTITIGVNNTFINNVKEKVAGLGLGLDDKLNRQMGTLSGGQRQALTLLMSVMDDCKYLLLDEPTAALDPRSAEKVMQIADGIVQQFKLTAILVTHNLKEAYTHGDRIIQLAEGKIIKDLGATEKAKLQQSDLFEWFT